MTDDDNEGADACVRAGIGGQSAFASDDTMPVHSKTSTSPCLARVALTALRVKRSGDVDEVPAKEEGPASSVCDHCVCVCVPHPCGSHCSPMILPKTLS